jgi:hypothetical protein
MMEQSTHETTHETTSIATEMSAKRERRRAEAMWRLASRHARRPVVGAAVAGTAVLAAGALCGVTEAALAGVAAWVVFRTLRKGASKSQANEKTNGAGHAEPARAAAE